MTKKAKAEFSITSWDEQAYAEFTAPEKLTRATVTQTYTGDLTGESRIDWLMYYGPGEDPVHYVGLERFTATIDGRSGTFVAQSKGTFTDGVAATTWFVVPGSGTGELAGLRGEGDCRATHDGALTVEFDHHFEE